MAVLRHWRNRGARLPVLLLVDRKSSVEQPRLFDRQFQGETARMEVFSLMAPMLDRMVSIVVVETTRRRTDAVRDILLGVLLPSLVLGAVTFALLAWGIRRGLQPLRDVAAEVAGREARAGGRWHCNGCRPKRCRRSSASTPC